MKNQPSNKPWYHKWVPSFWWDFNGNNIIVECDHPDFPLVAVYPVASPKYSEKEIKKAQKLIEDLGAGRKDFRKLAKAIPERTIVDFYGKDWRESVWEKIK